MESPESVATGGWRAKMTLEYDGTLFAGSQYQPGQRTVQGVMEEALARLTGDWRRITLAGRTDAGVHARGQVASVEVPRRFTPVILQRSLNAVLPDDVAVAAVIAVRSSFHARFDALTRRYGYSIWNSAIRSPLRRTTTWQVRAPLDVPAMRATTDILTGEHDFASFAGAGRGVPEADRQRRGTRRFMKTVTIDVQEESAHGRLIRIEVEASSFLPHMVRNMVGALVAVGRGEWSAATLREVLLATDRRRSAPTAPPQGLSLLEVTYGPEWDYHTVEDDTIIEQPRARGASPDPGDRESASSAEELKA